MKVLKLLFVVLLFAFLSTLMSATALANDHPWDDSAVDSSETLEADVDPATEPGTEQYDEPIIIKAKNWIFRFLKDSFAWGVRQEDNGEVKEISTEKAKSHLLCNKWKVRIK